MSQGEYMPHLVLEFTASVEEQLNIHGLFEDLHQDLLDCGLFEQDDVKSKAMRCNEWRIGHHGQSQDFIHISVALLAGRSAEQKEALSQILFETLTSQAKSVFSLSVEIREMEPSSYKKWFNRY
jgi:5-carboxymethyl-2-hydroxymuconate isomerase